MNGYIYVIGFDNGMVKVGRSSKNPSSRLMAHKNTMRLVCSNPVSEWVSCKHGNSKETELELIKLISCGESRSREWAVIDYNFVVDHAKLMNFQPLKEYKDSDLNFDRFIQLHNCDDKLHELCYSIAENIGLFVPSSANERDRSEIVSISYLMMFFDKKRLDADPFGFQADVISEFTVGGYFALKEYVYSNFYSDSDLQDIVKKENYRVNGVK